MITPSPASGQKPQTLQSLLKKPAAKYEAMTTHKILALFSETATDPRFPIAVGIAALAGLVRGFTGFGSALIYMPLVSAVYGPQVAAVTLLLIDIVCSLPVLDARHAVLQLARSRRRS